MKIKYRNNDMYIESHVSDLSGLRSLNLEGGYIAFLIPYSNNVEAVKQVDDYVISKNIKLKATDDAVELICNYADMAELEKDLIIYQRALELYIDDLELSREIDKCLRRKIMWLCLHIEGTIFNLLV